MTKDELFKLACEITDAIPHSEANGPPQFISHHEDEDPFLVLELHDGHRVYINFHEVCVTVTDGHGEGPLDYNEPDFLGELKKLVLPG